MFQGSVNLSVKTYWSKPLLAQMSWIHLGILLPSWSKTGIVSLLKKRCNTFLWLLGFVTASRRFCANIVLMISEIDQRVIKFFLPYLFNLELLMEYINRILLGYLQIILWYHKRQVSKILAKGCIVYTKLRRVNLSPLRRCTSLIRNIIVHL